MSIIAYLHVNLRANSSFAGSGRGVQDAPLHRAGELSPQDVAAIEEETAELYERALKEIPGPLG